MLPSAPALDEQRSLHLPSFSSQGCLLPLLHCAQRMFASQTEGELKVTQILKEKFPQATAIKVTDISGGCGAMYEIQIESEEFKEKRTVQQHQMVNQALKEEIKGMHGLRIFTSVPKH
nr:bolA-like protein 3 isoform X2 [Globicephala melas]